MRVFCFFALLVGVLAGSSPAEARPRHHGPVVRGGVRIVINPWAPGWAPAPRAGWVWIAGAYAVNGPWVPGYWAPASPRPGMVWVPGYWEGDTYVEGYWREEVRPGMVWVDGYYDRDHYLPGNWQAVGPPPPPAETVHHDYE